jgi:steroid delta-isomerase-like uncharacterized protein
MTASKALRALREAIVLEHMESENDHEFETALSTFDHARYEIIATGQVIDGRADVAAYYERTRQAFPDQRNRLIELHHSDHAVIVEFELEGTHLGSLAGEDPTGRAFKVRMTAFFVFEQERLVCERVYGDTTTILVQLGLAPAMAM